MISRRDALLGALAAAMADGLLSKATAAQDWPNTYVKLLVGGAPGSVPDSLARLAADALSARLGQSFVVENRAGAGGIVAMQGVATAAPDGYTIGLATISQLVFNEYLFAKLPYDPARRSQADLDACDIGFGALPPTRPCKCQRLPDLVALSKRDPGKLLLGIPANGSPPHIAALLLLKTDRAQRLGRSLQDRPGLPRRRAARGHPTADRRTSAARTADRQQGAVGNRRHRA